MNKKEQLGRSASDIRRLKRITQAEVAKQAKVSLSAVIDFEKGNGNSNLGTILKIGEVVGFDVEISPKQ